MNNHTLEIIPDPEVEKRKFDSLKAIEHRIDELPLLPTVVARLMSMDLNDNDYFDQVMSLASEDPPFAARLIHMANSAYFAHSKPITSIRSAVTLLGAKTIAGLITSLAVMRVFVPPKRARRNYGPIPSRSPLARGPLHMRYLHTGRSQILHILSGCCMISAASSCSSTAERTL